MPFAPVDGPLAAEYDAAVESFFAARLPGGIGQLPDGATVLGNVIVQSDSWLASFGGLTVQERAWQRAMYRHVARESKGNGLDIRYTDSRGRARSRPGVGLRVQWRWAPREMRAAGRWAYVVLFSPPLRPAGGYLGSDNAEHAFAGLGGNRRLPPSRPAGMPPRNRRLPPAGRRPRARPRARARRAGRPAWLSGPPRA